MDKNDIIGSSWDTEVSLMPQILCTGCKVPMKIETPRLEAGNYNPVRLVGTAICFCGASTGFEIERDTIVYVSGKSSYGILHPSLSETIRTLYGEAELCFQSGCPNGATAMCRASLEVALTEKNCEGADLYHRIIAAHEAKLLDDIEVGLAHASRLITRNAIHRGELIALSDVPSILSATVRILNKLANQSA